MAYTVFITRVSEYYVETESEARAIDVALGVLGRNAQEAALVGDETVRTDAYVADGRDIVQVEFRPGGPRYAYAVPEGLEYALGDQAVVIAATGTNIVEIVDHGRGGYRGPVKEIEGILRRGPNEPEPETCPDCGYQGTDASRGCVLTAEDSWS